MALTINLPSAGLLGISGAVINQLSANFDISGLADSVKVANRVIILNDPATIPAESTDDSNVPLYTVTLPEINPGSDDDSFEPNEGQQFIIKAKSAAALDTDFTTGDGAYYFRIETTTFEGESTHIEITENNQSITLTYVNSTFGWLVTN